MIKYSMLIMMLCGTSISTIPANAEPVEVFIIGVGRNSCGSWLQKVSDDFEVSGWILGAWTGLNLAHPTRNAVGSSTDAYGIIGEIRKRCEAKPSLSIAFATIETFEAMPAQ